MSPFSLADAVHVGVVELGVCTDLEVALAILDRIPHAAAAAESYVARLDCDLGCPQCGDCATFSASSQQLGVRRAARLLAGAWVFLCPCERSPKLTPIHMQYCLLMNCFSLFWF